MYDVMFPYILNVTTGDNELRYALRSIETNLSGWSGKVYIVGERPRWLKNVIHIPFPNNLPCREHNIARKVVEACNSDISDNFVFFNDDHYVLKPIHVTDIKNFYDHLLTNKEVHIGLYKKAVENTLRVLQERHYPFFHFDIHCPIIYNKEKFKFVYDSYDWSGKPTYIVKSLYCNSLFLGGVDMKDNVAKTHKHKDYTFDAMFISTSSNIRQEVMSRIEAMFPVKSRFE